MNYTNNPELNGKYLAAITNNVANLPSTDRLSHTYHVENVVLLELK